jgi:hypothetical protein
MVSVKLADIESFLAKEPGSKASQEKLYVHFVCTAAKENLMSVQEILLWFWQTKGGLN